MPIDLPPRTICDHNCLLPPGHDGPHQTEFGDPDPDPRDLVRELREAIGLFAGAMPCSPKEAWDGAIEEVRRLFAYWLEHTGQVPHIDGDRA